MDLNYKNIYEYFALRVPRTETNRKSDLAALLSIENSICLFSKPQNGATTLIYDFALRTNGIYIDCQGLPESPLMKLESRIDDAQTPVLFDETICLFRRFGGYEQMMNYVSDVMKKRQVVLRISPELYKFKDDFVLRGFNVIELGQIHYSDFKEMVNTKCNSVGVVFPEQFLEYAHSHFEVLGKSILYVAEAFKLLVENPEKELVDDKIMNILRDEYSRILNG